jgi:hypothetical protein
MPRADIAMTRRDLCSLAELHEAGWPIASGLLRLESSLVRFPATRLRSVSLAVAFGYAPA